jgi:hypothetical protein
MLDIHSTIDAFADGESVDPGQLKEALATTEGREYFVDVLVLRGFVVGDGSSRSALPSPPVERAMSRGRWLSAVAAIAVVSVLGGYVAGQQSVPSPLASDSTARARATLSAPEPTRVIKLEDSADWTERVGGN